MIIVKSDRHLRYTNGRPSVNGTQHCNRSVIIDIINDQDVDISIRNDDLGGETMTPKRMKIINVEETSNSRIVTYRGYGYDQLSVAMGIPKSVASFADYGMTLYFNARGEAIEKCVLHMYDRDVDIVYYACNVATA